MTVHLLQGFSAHWRNHPHRVNKLGVELSREGAHLTTRGGTWTTGKYGSDSMDFSARAVELEGPLQSFDGTSPELALSGSVRVRRSQPATCETTLSIELPTEFPAGAQLAVVLRGFSFDTDVSHAAGYTLRGLAVRLGQPTRIGNRLTLNASVRLEAGQVPDRIQGLRRYGALARIHYTVLGGPLAELHRLQHAYTLRSGAGIHPARPHASAVQQAVCLHGTPGLPVAVAAWRGFELRLNPEQKVLAGRYLRGLTLDLHDPRYDAERGVLRVNCDGHLSNAGLVSWPLTCAFSADLVLIQLPSGQVQPLAGEGPQTAERTTLALARG